MTFPANYAVMAEDELTYITGGGVIANVLPAVMTSDNWRNFQHQCHQDHWQQLHDQLCEHCSGYCLWALPMLLAAFLTPSALSWLT